MQGANYSLNQGFNYKTFKTAWIETKNAKRCRFEDAVHLLLL
jgi:hypothetical protein